MTMVLNCLKELSRGFDLAGLQPKILPGGLYWLANSVIENDVFSHLKCGEAECHVVLVMSIGDRYANVRFTTTKIDRNLENGLILEPDQGTLRRRSIVLTKPEYHLRVPKTALLQQKYSGTVDVITLSWIRVFESLTNCEEYDSLGGFPDDGCCSELNLAA